jgi:hypothetical protein
MECGHRIMSLRDKEIQHRPTMATMTDSVIIRLLKHSAFASPKGLRVGHEKVPCPSGSGIMVSHTMVTADSMSREAIGRHPRYSGTKLGTFPQSTSTEII